MKTWIKQNLKAFSLICISFFLLTLGVILTSHFNNERKAFGETNSHTYTIDYNGGTTSNGNTSGQMTIYESYYDDIIEHAIIMPVRQGYKFVGYGSTPFTGEDVHVSWENNKAIQKRYDPNVDTLYVQWKPMEFDLSLKTEGGERITIDPTPKAVYGQMFPEFSGLQNSEHNGSFSGAYFMIYSTKVPVYDAEGHPLCSVKTIVDLIPSGWDEQTSLELRLKYGGYNAIVKAGNDSEFMFQNLFKVEPETVTSLNNLSYDLDRSSGQYVSDLYCNLLFDTFQPNTERSAIIDYGLTLQKDVEYIFSYQAFSILDGNEWRWDWGGVSLELYSSSGNHSYTLDYNSYYYGSYGTDPFIIFTSEETEKWYIKVNFNTDFTYVFPSGPYPTLKLTNFLLAENKLLKTTGYYLDENITWASPAFRYGYNSGIGYSYTSKYQDSFNNVTNGVVVGSSPAIVYTPYWEYGYSPEGCQFRLKDYNLTDDFAVGYAYIGHPLPTFDKPTKSGGIFLGYFSEREGKGVQYYDKDMNPRMKAFHDFELDVLNLYPYWIDTWEGYAVEPIAGCGTLDEPYQISSAGNLAWIAMKVNSENVNFSEKYFKQTKDIDLSGKYWVPIGSENNPFQGYYNGGGYSITNVDIYNPLNDSSINSIVDINSLDYDFNDYFICSYHDYRVCVDCGETNPIYSVKNHTYNLNAVGKQMELVTPSAKVSLTAGKTYRLYLDYVTEYGDSQLMVYYGINGNIDYSQHLKFTSNKYVDFTVPTSCEEGQYYTFLFEVFCSGDSQVQVKNFAITEVQSKNIGIFGVAQNAGIHNIVIKNGNFVGTENVGSVLGCGGNLVSVTGCTNYSNVTSHTNAGGLVGYISHSEIVNCMNFGNVLATGNNAGGMVGTVYEKEDGAGIANCMNFGPVEALNENAGGISGVLDGGKIEVVDCKNFANVTAYRYVGGIIGKTRASSTFLSNLYSAAKINAKVTEVVEASTISMYAGGIVGRNEGTETQIAGTQIEGCMFSGTIVGINDSCNHYGLILGSASTEYLATLVDCHGRGNTIVLAYGDYDEGYTISSSIAETSEKCYYYSPPADGIWGNWRLLNNKPILYKLFWAGDNGEKLTSAELNSLWYQAK